MDSLRQRGGGEYLLCKRSKRKKTARSYVGYDGRLTTPSTCLRIVNGFTVFVSVHSQSATRPKFQPAL